MPSYYIRTLTTNVRPERYSISFKNTRQTLIEVDNLVITQNQLKINATSLLKLVQLVKRTLRSLCRLTPSEIPALSRLEHVQHVKSTSVVFCKCSPPPDSIFAELIFYRRYIDDVFAIGSTPSALQHDLNNLSSRDPNIQFTLDEWTSQRLPPLPERESVETRN
ncbi:hypothetical protein Y032_0213g2269 [Ancylostoma ceylanicum]|uniref:Uncharacterized protein n=1 Tax=Ancylostoma ceylanicum TaxID=53326 RepID=A0A016SKC9_9BILA|nr:hypothetical protein Y032_0213g2269 [Ancylostoma ceylanicum]